MLRGRGALVGALLILSTLSLAGCPGGAPGVPGGGGGGGGKVDPNTCGSYAASKTGAKIKAFLAASVELNDAVIALEADVKGVCADMAEALGIPGEGDTKTLCHSVATTVQGNLKGGLKAGAKLTVKYEPAVCTVSADVAASAAAECEVDASAEVSVRCEGGCSGTCKGECSGKCAGGSGGGECNGKCEGECKGECSGGCEGHADVNASAECRASAEVKANVKAECTEPKVEIAFDAGVVIDKPKVELTVTALKAGLPKMLALRAKAEGPIKLTVETWATSAKDLAKNAMKVAGSFGAQTACVAGQLKAAAEMVGAITGSASVSVSVSVEVSGSASGSAG